MFTGSYTVGNHPFVGSVVIDAVLATIYGGPFALYGSVAGPISSLVQLFTGWSSQLQALAS